MVEADGGLEVVMGGAAFSVVGLHASGLRRGIQDS